MTEEVRLVYGAIQEYLVPRTRSAEVQAAIEAALACPICGRTRRLACAGCRGRAGGQRSTDKKTEAVRENIKLAQAARHPKPTRPRARKEKKEAVA